MPEAMNRAALMFLLLSVLGWFAGCDRLRSDEALSFSGTLELTEHNVGARVAGRIVTLDVDEGDQVKKGAMIATLDRHDQARRDYERTLRIFEQGGATRQAVELAELALQDQAVVSPIDGIVITKVHETGDVVAAGSPLVTIGDRSDIWVRIFVPEGQVSRIRDGQSATVAVDGVEQSFQGRVTYIAPRAEFTPRNVQTPEERVTQTFAVKVRIEKPEAWLRPGVSADVVFPSGAQ